MDPSAKQAERPEDQERAGVSLARYAEITAELRGLGRARTAEILSRAGVSTDDWEKAEASWKAAIDGDLDGKAGLLLAFAAKFSETRRRLSRASDSVDAAATVSEPIHDGAASGPTPQAPPEPKAEVRVPTYLHAPPLTSPAPTRSAASLGRSLAATADLDLHSVVSRILPFDPGKTAPELSDSAPPTGGKPRVGADRAPVSLSAAHGATADLDIHQIVSKILPFGANAASTPESARPAQALPELTLGQYASFTAEIATSPEQAAETRTKYGVPTEQAHRALNTLWERRFAENGALHERWARLVEEYRAWLHQQR